VHVCTCKRHATYQRYTTPSTAQPVTCYASVARACKPTCTCAVTFQLT
jgi:hypothetical protein